MLNFNTQAKTQNRLFLSFEKVFKAIPPLSGGLKTSLLAALFCCASLYAHSCSMGQSGGPYYLNINATGSATLNTTFFKPFVTSTCSEYLPDNGGVVSMWVDAAGTVPFPPLTFFCVNVGDDVDVYVSLDDGPGGGDPIGPILFTVTIADDIAPILFAPAGQTVNAGTGDCDAFVDDLDASWTDNCSNQTQLSYEATGATTIPYTTLALGDMDVDLSGTYNVGVTTIDWELDDGTTTITGTTVITVVDDEGPTADDPFPVPPATVDVNGSCEGSISLIYPEVDDNCGTGGLTYEVTLTYVSGGTEIDEVISTSGETVTFSGLPLGTYEIDDILTDGNAGTEITHSYTVDVVDDTNPSFGAAPTSGPASAAGDCIADVLLDFTSFISDNCTDDGDLINSHTITTVSGGTAPTVPAAPNGAVIDYEFEPGVYDIDFTSEDESGNVGTHTYTITVTETMLPTASCIASPYNIALDSDGEVELLATELNDGSDDNCGIDFMEMRFNAEGDWYSSRTFDCDSIATSPYTVEFRVVDLAGNISDPTCMVTVNVVDNLEPTAQCQNISIDLDMTGDTEHEIDVDDVNNMSHDNCTDEANLDLVFVDGTGTPIGDMVTFDCSHVGTAQVILQVTDDATPTNSNTCTAFVTVNDVTDPVAVGMAYSDVLDSDGELTVNASVFEDASTDNCTSPINSFRFSLSMSGPFVGEMDFDCDDIGMHDIWFEVTDESGNTDVEMIAGGLEIEDDEDPDPICPSAVVDFYLDGSGEVDVTALDMGAGSTDNCEVDDVLIRRATNGSGNPFGPGWATSQTFDCGDIGLRSVRLWVNDPSDNPTAGPPPTFGSFGARTANTEHCQQLIRINDDMDPSAGCVDLSVGLGNTGEVIVTAFQIGISSSDNCTGFLGLDREISINGVDFFDEVTFDCTNLGANSVEMQVIDDEGNAASCIATVTIQDNEDPVLTIPGDVTIECDEDSSVSAQGMASATDNTDDCSMVTITHDDVTTDGICDGESVIEREWTATDAAGNSVFETQTITIRDMTAPEFEAPDDSFMNECPDTSMIAAVENAYEDDDPSAMMEDDVVPNGGSLLRMVTFAGVGKILDLDLDYNFSGATTWNLELTSPSGQKYTMTDGGSEAPSMGEDVYFGDEINGDWTLEVFNTGGSDFTLDDWDLDIDFSNSPDATPVTGDATITADNCDSAKEPFYVDYQAQKGFIYDLEDFAPGEWSDEDFPGTDDEAFFSATKDSLTIIGSDDGTCPTMPAVGIVESYIGIEIPDDGCIVFDWEYSTDDARGMTFDPFGYSINGVIDTLSKNMITSGRVVLDLEDGDDFRFFIRSRDEFCGAATALITNFVFTEKDEPESLSCPHEWCFSRFWYAVDACGNVADAQVQVITSDDTTDPVIDHVSTMTVQAMGNTCSPFVDLDLSGDISDACGLYGELTIWNSALVDYGFGDEEADASGNYPPGTYEIEFIVIDACENSDTLDLVLTVEDGQNPTAVCLPAVTVQLDNTGNATLAASSVDNGSSDNCPGLGLTLSQSMFDTDDIGVQTITMTSTDAAGNTNSCTSEITVLGGIIFDAQDASGPSGGTADVSVTATDFVEVTSFSMDVEIVDGAIATVGAGGVTVLAPALNTDGVFTAVVVSSTQVTVTWFSTNPAGLTLAAGAPLFSVEADLIGATGTTTDVEINNDEVYTVPGGIINPAPSIGLNGTIDILNTAVQYTISGTLTREDNCTTPTGDPIDNVTVTLAGATSTPPSPDADADGSYSFSVAEGSSFTITPFKDGTTTGLPTPGTWFTGIDISDVLAVNEHFLGLSLLDSDYKKIAADANANGSIQVADVFIINQLSLFTIPTGLPGTAWRFVDEGFTFPASAPLVVPSFPESVSVTGISADETANFIGVKIGDVNCDADPSLFTGGNTADGSGDPMPFLAADQYLTAGQEVTVAFTAKDFTGIKGYQMTVRFDSDVIAYEAFQAGALAGLSENNLNPMGADQGVIAANWFGFEPTDLVDGETVFAMTFTVLSDSKLSDVLTFNSDLIEAKAVKAGNETIGVDLEFDSPNSSVESHSSNFALYQNSPNPFAQSTKIGFRLGQADRAKLTVLDASGRVLKVIENNFSAGYHQVNIDRDDLPSSGVLFYQLETSTDRAIRKMVLLD